MTANPSTNEHSAGVTVFCPQLVLTVTLEADSKNQPELHIHAGGQGFWVARMIAKLGVSATLCAPIGDDTGRVLQPLIGAENVQLRAVPISGCNGAYVHDRREGDRYEICRIEGSQLTRHELDDLYNATFTESINSRLLVLTGQSGTPIVPRDVYCRLASDVRANGCMVIADLSGDDLREALKGGIDLLCFSHKELNEQEDAPVADQRNLIAALRVLQKKGARQIILHREAEPTILLLDDQLLQVIGPRVTPLDHRGGGDTFLAALAVCLVQKRSIDETIPFAAAAGTLNVLRHGLGTGNVRDILALGQHIRLQPLEA
jgi:1-phosphofructokinase